MLKIPGKIPVYIHPFFWILCAALGWIITNTLSGMVVLGAMVFFSVLFHEYGHALTALAFGHPSTITLFGLGGVTERKGQTQLKTWQECLIIFNGPLAGFILVCIFYYAYRYLRTTGGDPFFVYFFSVGYQINLFWTVLNLFPVHPLDGGKLVSLIMQRFFGIRGLKMALFSACFLQQVWRFHFS